MRLLPRCCAMIHHGGTGTTAAAARAGIPAGVLSVFGDQHFWGRRVDIRIGVHERFWRLTLDRLIGMLRALRDEGRIARAAAVGEQMRAEDSNALLLDAVERSAESAPIPQLS
jgi:sterol 3beta-glucosyltransferase